MLRRRAALFEPLLTQLNPNVYQDTLRQFMFDLGDIHGDVADIRSGHKHPVKKINEAYAVVMLHPLERFCMGLSVSLCAALCKRSSISRCSCGRLRKCVLCEGCASRAQLYFCVFCCVCVSNRRTASSPTS